MFGLWSCFDLILPYYSIPSFGMEMFTLCDSMLEKCSLFLAFYRGSQVIIALNLRGNFEPRFLNTVGTVKKMETN